MSIPEIQYMLALSMVPGVGPKFAKQLIAHCGSAKAVLNSSAKELRLIPNIGPKTVKAITEKQYLKEAEEELAFTKKNKLKVHGFLDKDYPQRLKNCEDGPLILYQKGELNLNAKRIIAVVGTRNATTAGIDFCEKFVEDLKQLNVVVISGLAYGIDACAHKSAVKHTIPTAAVFAHGLDTVYPGLHANLAKEMVDNGGALLTEFGSNTNPDRQNFPKRNRIVAGISDAVVVVEAAKKGGALITAEIANSYNRDVFAVPGRVGDKFSEGCNMLIKSHRAALLTGIEDLNYLLGWEKVNPETQKQESLFVSLTEKEQVLYNALQAASQKQLPLEKLCSVAQVPVGQVLSTLMGMELKGIVKTQPGKIYRLV